jgi:putative addiction module component (TIGR02574 family)
LASLTIEERADLAYFLISSLDEAVESDADAAWDAELSQRTADIESGKAVGKPAAQVFSKLRELHVTSYQSRSARRMRCRIGVICYCQGYF